MTTVVRRNDVPTFQALDPYVHELWQAIMAAPDIIQYHTEIQQGYVSTIPPPRPYLVQVSQYQYETSRTFDRPPPIAFYVNGHKGILLSHALARIFGGLFEGERSVERFSNADKTTYRLFVPGCNPFERHSPARRATTSREFVSRQTIARHVAKAVQAFIERNGGIWHDSVAGNVMFEEILLLELRRVSEGSWQPFVTGPPDPPQHVISPLVFIKGQPLPDFAKHIQRLTFA
ncbi:hypothetical protein EIP86_007878 [Pleurotus ostreatoroseus]|nr:hypothetical protein EIP86_007878 [Pleurotus ostreatoroseus]